MKFRVMDRWRRFDPARGQCSHAGRAWRLLGLLALPAVQAAGAAEPVLEVIGQRVANLEPASSFAAPVTALRFDPRIDVQARGFPEAQADLSVRGGLFENNALNVGPLSVRDPQTGHYLAELPLDPRMLSMPEILTGVDSALAGFNASVATVQYGIAPVVAGGAVSIGAGTDDLRTFDGRVAETFGLGDLGELGAAVAYADSRGDGTRPFGDHDFERLSAQLQHRGDGQQTDLLFGRQDKFFGWPGMYTGFATFPETDDTRTRLVLGNHRRELSGGSWLEIGAYHRNLEDDYDFDRRTSETGARGAFEHETESYAVAARGLARTAALDWHWSAQWLGDKLVDSTDLVGGSFDERRYARLAVAPEKTWALEAGATLALKAGLVADRSDRDSDELLPLARLAYSRSRGDAVERFSVEYSGTSQVPGYTALKSPPNGLFGGNPELGRERADTIAIAAERESAGWFGRAAAFLRRDDDLVDWTFRSAAPFVRQANPVDMDVAGLELELARRWDRLELMGGYLLLDKDEDYGSATVDASYYALNFAEQRLTISARYRPFDWLDVRLDNGLSRYRDNALRTSGRDAWQVALAVGWLTQLDGLRVDLLADNLTNEGFQYFPGSPAPRRQWSIRTQYAW